MASVPKEAPARITGDDVAFYRENGYLVVPDALAATEVETLRAETAALCRGERGAVSRLPKASSGRHR